MSLVVWVDADDVDFAGFVGVGVFGPVEGGEGAFGVGCVAGGVDEEEAVGVEPGFSEAGVEVFAGDAALFWVGGECCGVDVEPVGGVVVVVEVEGAPGVAVRQGDVVGVGGGDAFGWAAHFPQFANGGEVCFVGEVLGCG